MYASVSEHDNELLVESGDVALTRDGASSFVLRLAGISLRLSSRDLAEVLTVCLFAATRTGDVTVTVQPEQTH